MLLSEFKYGVSNLPKEWEGMSFLFVFLICEDFTFSEFFLKKPS